MLMPLDWRTDRLTIRALRDTYNTINEDPRPDKFGEHSVKGWRNIKFWYPLKIYRGYNAEMSFIAGEERRVIASLGIPKSLMANIGS